MGEEVLDRLMPGDLQRAAEALGERPSSCFLCSNGDQVELFQSSGKVFWLCSGCSLVYVHDIYPEFVQPPAGEAALEELSQPPKRRRRKFDQWLAQMARFGSASSDSAPRAGASVGKLLDVGCGQGEFLAYAAGAGWQVQGVDVDPLRVALARDKRGLQVFEGELHEASYPSDSFDVVFMSEVIEHIVDPVPLMQEIHRILRPGGIAFLRTGNGRSWAARLRGAAWDYYRFCFHGHIRYYSPKSAQALARASGFESVDVETHGFAFMESQELKQRWFKIPVKLAQGLLSPLVGPLGGGHRLRMIFRRART